MPWRVSSFRSRAGFSARMTTSRQPPAWTGATITPPNFPGSSCITAFSYTLKSLERAKKLKEVTLRTLLHKASQKGIIVVAGTKARLSINARLGNSLPVIDHKQAAPKKITAQTRHSCALSLPKKEFCHNRRTFYQQTEASIAITHPNARKSEAVYSRGGACPPPAPLPPPPSLSPPPPPLPPRPPPLFPPPSLFFPPFPRPPPPP